LASEVGVERMRAIKYTAPEALDRPKVIVPLDRSDILGVHVQVVAPNGGETNMHAHAGMDSCWYVLKGRARFYGFGDELVAEAGRDEGVFIPKGVPYWFEAAGDEPLEVLHITARDTSVANDRVNYRPALERQAAFDQGGRPPTEEELRAAKATR
jgi:mannose-6-phosphate isomerase-like protein (cupin superfamily)